MDPARGPQGPATASRESTAIAPSPRCNRIALGARRMRRTEATFVDAGNADCVQTVAAKSRAANCRAVGYGPIGGA